MIKEKIWQTFYVYKTKMLTIKAFLRINVLDDMFYLVNISPSDQYGSYITNLTHVINTEGEQATKKQYTLVTITYRK